MGYVPIWLPVGATLNCSKPSVPELVFTNSDQRVGWVVYHSPLLEAERETHGCDVSSRPGSFRVGEADTTAGRR